MSGTYQTNGIVDLIDRRATWGEERVRIVDVRLARPDKGAEAKVRLIKNGKEKWVPVQYLKLVPLENMPDRVSDE